MRREAFFNIKQALHNVNWEVGRRDTWMYYGRAVSNLCDLCCTVKNWLYRKQVNAKTGGGCDV